MLKLIYVGNLPPFPGGGAVMGAQLLHGLAGRGVSVRALAPITPGEEDPYEGDGLPVERFAMPSYDVGTRPEDADAFRDLEAERIGAALPAMIAAERPDVVVAGRETYAWHVPAIAREHGLPCMVILQGTTTAAMLRGTYPRADELVERYRLADLVVAPARHMTRILDGVEVRAIPNTLDVGAFRPLPRADGLAAELGIDDGDVVVLHASNLKRVKRPMDLVRSAEGALARDPRLLYLVLGKGDAREEMEEACDRAGIAGRFRFAGWVDHARVPEHLSLADLVVMTSEFEAQSLAKLEAQACGRCLLSSDVDGARELITDGRTGLLYRAGDIDHLVERTLEAAADPALRERIGDAARGAALGHSREAGIDAYLAAIEGIVGRSVA